MGKHSNGRGRTRVGLRGAGRAQTHRIARRPSGARTSLSPTSTLLLARLGTTPAGSATQTRLVRDLLPLIGSAQSRAECGTIFETELRALHAAGHVEPGARASWRITASGRSLFRECFGAAPGRGAKWSALKQYQLPALALAATNGAPAADIRSIGGLRAAILDREYGLGLDPSATLAQARDALAWKQLGVSTTRPFKVRTVLEWAFGRLLELEREIPVAEALARLAALKAGARRPDPTALAPALLRRWTSHSKPAAPRSMPLAEFAQVVGQGVRECPGGRFGPDKVFISHVWGQLRDVLGSRGIDEARFKKLLVDANREDLLALDRADLVPAMDPEDVAASETRYLNATFHFIRAGRKLR
jgi:hypothetical protein